MGKVYLVGAGPGDSGLLTLKGLECIKRAEVIVYDSLVSPTLLNFANQECRLIYAGKIAGNHSKTQDEINGLLWKYAEEGKQVVRLKGGDPFVFGRGGEEAEYLAERGVEFEVVPGVSSCYSVPAYSGIPVTHRGYASSFHVVTAHGRDGSEGIDYKNLAEAEGTIVFLMGLKSLDEIARGLMENGKSPRTPAAVISR
ncbi:MAG: uroporphyrinogen-III C-methyltransferase, partial [Clostridia bacterium]